MAQRFSLKDNPIFQKFAPHTPSDTLTSLEDTQEKIASGDAGQNLTVTERLSENDAQKLPPNNVHDLLPSQDIGTVAPQQIFSAREDYAAQEGVDLAGQNLTVTERLSENDAQKLSPVRVVDSSPSAQEPLSSAAMTHGATPQPGDEKFTLQDHLDKALFFGFYNEVADELLPTLPPAAQVLYSRLFRLSYGFNRNYCTVSQPLLMERTGLSRNTIRTALQALLENSWIQIIGAGNRISTTYRVIVPREKRTGEQYRGAKIDTQKVRGKNRHSESEGQNMRGSHRRAEFDLGEGQKRDGQNLHISREKSYTTRNNNSLLDRISNFDAQDLPALLLTHRSSTLSESTRENQHLSHPLLVLSARELTDKFYSLLGQRVSKSKRKKSLDECLGLLQEGFSAEEIDYAISWLITHHPTTGSFARLPHFIDQALKARDMQSQDSRHHASTTRTTPDDLHRQQQERDEAQHQARLEALKASLSPSALAALRAEAEQSIDQEHPSIKFGRDTLVRLKLEELMTTQYLGQQRDPDECSQGGAE